MRQPFLLVTIWCFAMMATCSHVGFDDVHAESYIAGQFGVTLPQDYEQPEVTTHGFGGLTTSDQTLATSLMGGMKLGHFLTSARWFGIETEVFYTTPHIKQGPLAFSGPGGTISVGTAQGLHNRIITWAPFNLTFRYPKYRLQPYLAVGPGIFFSRFKDSTTGETQGGTNLGLNTQVGLRYYVTRRWTMFVEWKFNHARLRYTSNDQEPSTVFGFKATYSAHILALGIGYHF